MTSKKRLSLPPETLAKARRIVTTAAPFHRGILGTLGRAEYWRADELQPSLNLVRILAEWAGAMGEYLALLHLEMRAAVEVRPARTTRKRPTRPRRSTRTTSKS